MKEWTDGEREDAPLFTELQSLTHVALRAQQQEVERQLSEIVTAKISMKEVDPVMAASARRLIAQWQVIEQEWQRRAALIDNEAVADIAHGWPSE